VDQAVLVQAQTAHGYDNNYCADAAAAHPHRFVGVARIDPMAGAAPDLLSYWVEERGMRGVRLGEGGNTGTDNPWLADPKIAAFWQRAEELGVPICLQVRRADLEMVRGVLERFPGVTVLLDHLAHASVAELAPLARFPHFHLKFSTMNVREASRDGARPEEFFEALAERYGADRLLWSSDYPHTKGTAEEPYKGGLDLARRALSRLTAEDQAWVLGETARKVYPALAGTG
jgi:predicted TIM-barrel fold metal-dependent hydrolase